MNIDVNKLVKVRTYARQKNFSTQWVRQLALLGKVKMIDIDGVKFIKVD